MPAISKSSFIRGCQCHKSLYFNFFNKELRDPIPDSLQAVFDRGHDIGALAQQLFPGGVDVSPGVRTDVPAWTRNTMEQIRSGAKVIYEAAIANNNLFAASDILVRTTTGWKIYEVKSSTSVSDTYLKDVTFQYHLFSSAGLNIEDVSIVHINNQYIRQGVLDIQQFFTVVSVMNEVLDLQDTIMAEITAQKAILTLNKAPNIDIGLHCFDPYSCDFYSHCWSKIPDNSVFNISRLTLEKKFELYKQGYITFDQIPVYFPLSEKQWLQVSADLSGKSHINKKAIREFVSSLNYPLFFMDFETIMPCVPMFDNSRPYQQLCFQFSVHYLENKNAESEHSEFLAESDELIDPRIPFIESLLKVIEKPGDILVYNKGFETARLNEIAETFPEYAERIEQVISRIKDMMTPFQNKDYYLPEMKGSYSIKAVLPALVPSLSYDDLEIQEGGTASATFESLYFEKDASLIQKTRHDLLEYCKMDTLAMVEIWRVLVKI